MDSNWQLMKISLPTTPSIAEWLAKKLVGTTGSKQYRVGFDPSLVSFQLGNEIALALHVNCMFILHFLRLISNTHL